MSRATTMDVDDPGSQSLKKKAEALHTLAAGPLSSSISKLSFSSRAIPSEKDFHFFYNFDEFKSPVKEISDNSHFMLERVGTSTHLWGKDLVFPKELDDSYDWLVNVNDELFERFDVSADEFQSLRKKEEEGGRLPVVLNDGFQLVYGKKMKNGQRDRENVGLVDKSAGAGAGAGASASGGLTGVKVSSRENKVPGAKPRVPFHIPSIPRPQDTFNILVNNSNQPFQHVWLGRSEDGTRFIHPLEELSVLDFVAKDSDNIEPVKPPPIEHSPFKLVEEVKDLKELAAKLRAVDEFAVDLEHNQYRSFQGMTCLMQISTRSEDFVIDTLKLRIHVGPYLREVFKDPSKKKVMHGADKDILWLQRDFGIYVCNLFDTGQASRLLKLERNSLEHLLRHFCGVTADKEYQNAEWRLRPLPYEMLKYAREDTHYLLYIYDLMRIRLLSITAEKSDNLLLEVYKRSYDVCMQLYEKELLTESSYLYIYGLQRADFNSQQLAAVSGLCEWRDVIGRAEDESTGYILPNRTLLEIAKELPVTTNKLRRLLKTKHPYVERNLGSIVSIIKHSIQNAPAFEEAAEHLKELASEHLKQVASQQLEGQMEKDPETSTPMETADDGTENVSVANKMNGSLPTYGYLQPQEAFMEAKVVAAGIGRDEPPHENLEAKTEISCYTAEQPCVSPAAKDAGAMVQLRKKPTRAFGALFGNSVPKRKADVDSKCKEQLKLEQIKSSVNVPFYSFSGSNDQSKPFAKVPTSVPETPSSIDLHSTPVASNLAEVSEAPSVEDDLHSRSTAVGGRLEDIISLDDGTDVEDSRNGDPESLNERLESDKGKTQGPAALELDGAVEPMSLSDLSTSFQHCFETVSKRETGQKASKSQDSPDDLQLEPFDYEAARTRFGLAGNFKEESGMDGGEDGGGNGLGHGGGKKKKGSGRGPVQKAEGVSGDMAQGKRRQAFPASGNRSATFR